MNAVSKTLYIPLYGKALVTKKGMILHDARALEIWEEEGFALGRRARSKWLAYFMAMRGRVFDEWVKEQLQAFPNALVLHLGCGLDSRVERICAPYSRWIDVDMPDVISVRKRHFEEKETYQMLGADICEADFSRTLPFAEHAIVVLEGVCMYLPPKELERLLAGLVERYPKLSLLLDVYSPFAARMSRIKNPVRGVGVKRVYGIKCPCVLTDKTGPTFVRAHEITPRYLLDELHGWERFYFRHHYAGRVARGLYRLYEYQK